MLKSCGVLVFCEQPAREFLLMKHTNRWDLPKGHVDPGETDLQCALRELEEETGINPRQLRIDEDFRFTTYYQVRYTRLESAPQKKTLVIFLGWLQQKVSIQLTEHPDYQWVRWDPPHQIQIQTIDPLLEQVAAYFKGS